MGSLPSFSPDLFTRTAQMLRKHMIRPLTLLVLLLLLCRGFVSVSLAVFLWSHPSSVNTNPLDSTKPYYVS